MIELEAAFTKTQLTSVFAQRDTVNVDHAEVGDKLWSPGTLHFVGFVGRWHDDGLYHGLCRFDAALEGSTMPRQSFAELMQWISLGADRPAETCAIEETTSDGIQSDDNEER
ncbi:MAG: hypothetical protein GTO41_28700 [Burkholderiales bacterium]|nr:hypothetical protein [Burkholderiales bacterium]